MAAEIIYGSELAQEIRSELKSEVETLNGQGIHPKLSVIIIGDDPASKSYVRGKQKASNKIGMDADLWEYDSTITEPELLNKIEELNNEKSVHGILVQLPLPEHIEDQKVIEAISPEKDVDGFHPISIGKMMTNQETFLPCTPHGIIVMMERAGIELEGKHAVILGRSNLVGKPVGQLLLNKNATVTYCHSKTEDAQNITKQADILIVAIGKPSVISAEDIKSGAVVIDVGVNRVDGKLTGDVDFESVKEKASYLTPVPKGVGPMTITMLLHNTIEAAKRIHQ
ncbi:bifunctional methylenetetrahydrofolate dehydrogenase/methenyltetrahydrofolate cyclohydrolase [Salimicrobium jeotgali]|uniref:Bifunctional protein FolD n=1 Tax=Salimicrobium jeotgali TaxID=1230341 RepID=K2GDF1_9BACI|nr:bifunctional methylenetetrahydrofolate dehydrogenase/methenyltetrahydrofolate cyclohydrolase [Salimicrobium jeotgali]AKG04332.1 bifunctional methylenetetrahydrofolate dehydrogenase/methenyltetrahydrofolate cyclohydrolase [Salimicrobium jeotgali]EKE32307.1 bifunctional 5,10-methylene-tetrahydrofolate dehydrogenase/ 5,10-methylene-tetrahydrofolate cyclohydrolase [Salimicrobium jeotgali]MBM7695920.1 methylenetetrahydrofolate dehydrogenase (NADP+)/methenyltetrahydrofolate cyclohydrolase [Salimicr